MQNSSRLKRLRLVTEFLILAILGFTAFWVVDVVSSVADVVFTDAIYGLRVVEANAEVTFLMRFLYGGLWCSVVAIGLFASLYAIAMLNRIKGGQYFGVATAKSMKQFGAALSLCMIADTILAAFSRSILTWGNAPFDGNIDGSVGYIGPSYFYDPGDITAFFCGVGFFIVGWLLEEGGRIEDEFRAIV